MTETAELDALAPQGDTQALPDVFRDAIAEDGADTGHPLADPDGDTPTTDQDDAPEGDELPGTIAQMTEAQAKQSLAHQKALLDRQGNELGELRKQMAELQASSQTTKPTTDDAPADVEADELREKFARVTPRFQQLYQEYVDEGYDEEAAKQKAWVTADGEDTRIQATAEAMVRKALAPYARLIEQEIVPATITREIQRTLGDSDVPADEVLRTVTEAFGIEPAALNGLVPAMRTAVFKLAADAVKGRRVTSTTAKAPPVETPATLTRSDGRTKAPVALSREQRSEADKLKGAFGFTDKDLDGLV